MARNNSEYDCTNFHCGEKAKTMRLQPITIYTILNLFYVYLKVQGDDGTPLTTPPFFARFPYSGVLRRAELGVFPRTTIHHAQQHFGQGD